MADIIDLNYLSVGFPNKEWSTLVERENFIDSILSKLDEKNKIVFLSGEEGIGKTTFLGQFCRKNYKNSISVFFSPFHTLDLNLDFLRTNLTSQINLLLGNSELKLESDDFVSSEKYRISLINLKKKFRNSRDKIYIIIDGLENRGQSNYDAIHKILQEIPFGEDYFNFIIAGTFKEFEKALDGANRFSNGEISLVGFGKSQIKEFLGDDSKIIDEKPELIRFTKGYPGRLEVLRRLVQEGYELDKISSSDNFKSWLDLDTEKIDLSNKIINLILSLLSLNDRKFSTDEIAKITGETHENIEILIKGIHVLEDTNGIVQFISEGHSRYFSGLLRGNRRNCEDLLVKYYATADTLGSKFELSKLYADQKKWRKIIDLIDEPYLQGTMQSTGSLDRVNESLELGYRSSEALSMYSKVYMYSFQGSIVNELDNYLFWESEIMARISLNDFAGAIDLAEKAVLKIDRLRLLSLVAKKEKQINNKVDDELIGLIQNLYRTTSLVGIGDVIYDIVANLIYAIPNIALEMIERSAGDVSSSNINDWIVAKLSIAAITSDDDEKGSSGEKEEKLKTLEKLNNPSVRKIQRAISLMVGNYSSAKVLEEVRKLTDSNEKLKLLRLWLKNNRNHQENLNSVIEVTFDELVLYTSDSDSTLDTLIDLSFQLNKIRDKEDKQRLLSRFKEFDKNIHGTGLDRDYYVYKLNIFHAQYFIDFEASEIQLSKIINKVNAIKDDLIRVESYCEVFYKLFIINDRRFITLYNRVYGRIKSGAQGLLKNTANHLKITENIITTISKVNPMFSLEICNQINNLRSRDRARLNIIDSHLDNSIKHIGAENLHVVVASIENDLLKEVGVQSILERYINSKSLPFDKVKEILPFISEVKNFWNKERRLDCQIMAYHLVSKNTNWFARLSEPYKKAISKTWNSIESDWDKIDCGFIIASELSKLDEVFAKDVFEKTIIMKNQSWLDSSSVASTYINSLKLLLKAYSALIKNGLDLDKDFDRFKELVSRIPSEVERLKLWVEIAIRIIISENTKLTKRIYNTHIIPLVASIIENNKGVENVLEVFVVIHYHNSDLALEYLDQLSEYFREKACLRISDFYINQRNPFENYDGEIVGVSPSFDNLFKAVKLLNRIQTDNLLFSQISRIASIISDTNIISAQQKSELKIRMYEIVNEKLPDQNNITHDGYKILCEVLLQNIDRDSNISWESYVERANSISNRSDRLFVKSNLLEKIPFKGPRDRELKTGLIDDIIKDLDLLTTHYEYVDRVIDLSEIMHRLAKTRWQKVVNKAFDLSYRFVEGIERYDYQKNIVDTMYRIDENFAKTLMTKSQPSDSEINKKLLKNYYTSLELGKKIKNNQSLEELERNNQKAIIRAIFKAQCSLNSGKISTKKVADVAKYLMVGRDIGLRQAYPVFSYFLSNSANLKLLKNQKNNITDLQRETFEYMIRGIKLVELLSHKRKQENSLGTQHFIDEKFSENLVVRPGTREDALNYIREWILEEVDEFLIITDPYLQKEDVEILKFVKELDDELDICFLGCQDASSADLNNEFEMQWKKTSDENPPFSKFIFCWVPEDKSKKPIHDRWILSKNGGLRLGTSFNSLGQSRDSEISIMKTNEALNIQENIINGYITNKTRHYNNQKLRYFSFTI